jgi:hypothetical protein
MRPLLTISLVLLLTGCGQSVEKAFNLLFGKGSNDVVLVDKAIQLGPATQILLPGEHPMKVLGEWSSVCLALRDDVPLQDAKTMDRVFSDAMRNAKVAIELTLSDGTRFPLGRSMQSWHRYGRVLDGNELSACSSAPCGTRLPVGLEVKSVAISSDTPLAVQGIYWSSEADLPKPPPAKKKTPNVSLPSEPSTCTQ